MIHAAPQASTSPLEALALSERFVLWSFRAWACCCRGRRLPAEPVASAFANIGAPAAAVALDDAMTRLVLGTSRPLTVHCPPHPGLSEDETRLLAAVAAAQRHDRDDLARLFAEILAPPASALLGRSLMELGAAIATVGVLLPQPGPEKPVSAPEGRPRPAAATLH